VACCVPAVRAYQIPGAPGRGSDLRPRASGVNLLLAGSSRAGIAAAESACGAAGRAAARGLRCHGAARGRASAPVSWLRKVLVSRRSTTKTLALLPAGLPQFGHPELVGRGCSYPLRLSCGCCRGPRQHVPAHTLGALYFSRVATSRNWKLPSVSLRNRGHGLLCWVCVDVY